MTLHGTRIWRGPSPGITYFIATEPYSGWVKIGRSSNDSPDQRLLDGQCWSPHSLVVRAVLKVDIEQDLHALYATFRGPGEWFALPSALLAAARKDASTLEKPLKWFQAHWSGGHVVRAAEGPGTPRTPNGFARRFASAQWVNLWVDAVTRPLADVVPLDAHSRRDSIRCHRSRNPTTPEPPPLVA
jgi:hypothetical protein